MSWRYRQSTGELFDPQGKLIARGYSGAGRTPADGRNNPLMQGVQMKGPIPRGRWKIGLPYKHTVLGPICMNLDTMPGTDALGRSLFRIHGDNAQNDASHGCVILGPAVRRRIAGDDDRILEVVE